MRYICIGIGRIDLRHVLKRAHGHLLFFIFLGGFLKISCGRALLCVVVAILSEQSTTLQSPYHIVFRSLRSDSAPIKLAALLRAQVAATPVATNTRKKTKTKQSKIIKES
jgi:hypothetical protein